MYIVIETFGGIEYATILMNENGSNKVFDTKKEAQKEANLCQNAIVVKI